jgi:hypothetical protein
VNAETDGAAGLVPAARPLPRHARAAVRRLLEEVVSEQGGPGPAGRRQRWLPRRFSRGMVLLVVGVTALGGGVAGALEAVKPAAEKRVVRCYSEPALGTGAEFPGVTVARGNGPGPVPIHDALRTCAELWRQGVIVAGVRSPAAPVTEGDSRVPRLAACTLATGVAAVFPGDADTCRRLGLPDLAAA